jgi:PAS domain S-box-containing protein
MEEALRASEERFRLAADAASALVYEVDLRSGASVVVHGLERVIGLEPADLSLSSDWWHARIHPDDLPGHMAELERHLKAGGSHRAEYRVRHADDRWIYVEDSRQVLLDENGTPARLVGAVVEITERKQAEQELAASRDREHHFRERLAKLHEVSLELAAAESVDELCRRAVELGRKELGFDRVGIFLLEAQPNIVRGTYGTDGEGNTCDEREWYGPARAVGINRILLAGERFVFEPGVPVRFSDRGGVSCPHALAALWDGERTLGVISTDNLLTGQPVTQEWREILRHYGAVIGHLISRHRHVAALRESEARFRVLADTAPCCIWTAAPDGSVTYANDRWYEFSGLTPEQTAGLEWAAVIHPDDQDRCLRTWLQAAQDGTPYEIEVRNRRKDGVYRWLLTRAVPVRDQRGEISAWFGTATDIHDQKMAQEALREADRRKDEFIAVLAHELRNPLAPIRNAVQLLLRLGPDEPRLVRARQTIERQVRHQARLIDDLLDVSRITRGKIQLCSERLDLTRVIRDAVEDCGSVLAGAGVQLSLELPEEAVWVEGDAIRLAQVVGNLLQNAAKFTDQGGRVFVCLAVDRESQRAVIRVRDTGIGIEPEMLPHVFETFAQADRSLDRSLGGLGLGLALVKGLVDLHGGEVRARSEGLGQGAEFTILLPLAPSGTAPRSEEISAPPRAARPIRVLIVEDHPDSAQTLRELLELTGHTVEVAYTGAQAVKIAPAFQPDAVLCDLGLPGLNGFQVAQALRRNPMTAGARLVALSGYGQEEDQTRSREAGFDEHLTKPVEFAQLARLLETAPTAG